MSHKGGASGGRNNSVTSADSDSRDTMYGSSRFVDPRFERLVIECRRDPGKLVHGDPRTAENDRDNMSIIYTIQAEIVGRMERDGTFLPPCMPGGGEISSPPTLENLANENMRFSPVWYSSTN